MRRRTNRSMGLYTDPFDSRMKPGSSVLEAPPTAHSMKAVGRPNPSIAPREVALPDHLFVPPGCEVIDARVAAEVTAGTTNELFFSFTCPDAVRAHFIAYSVFSDGTDAANQLFVPRKDGKRVFPYHGDPNDGFKINLGLGPDLSNANLIQCQLSLNPGEKIEWFVTQTSGVDVAMGVRMFGYIDAAKIRNNANAGG